MPPGRDATATARCATTCSGSARWTAAARSFPPAAGCLKNAAGYNLCRLLTGSLGTLGIVTQVTLLVRPLPETSALAACDLHDLAAAERLLAALVRSETLPVAVELRTAAGASRRRRAAADARGQPDPARRRLRGRGKPKSSGWWRGFASNGGTRASRR